MSAMRFNLIAAARTASIATTIQMICRTEGQPRVVARAASNAPVSANGSANTECSNLIISSTVRMRPAMTSGASLSPADASRPAIHLVLRQAGLRQHAANVLRHDFIDGFGLEIKCGYHRHDHRPGLLYPEHILEMNS